MRVVIHAGMHKTGTSSIQNFFYSNERENIVYPRWFGPNHCGLFILLFQDEELLGEYHGFKTRGAEFVASLKEKKRNSYDLLEKAIEQAKNTTLLISAEDISWPGFRNAVSRMHSFFQSYTEDIQVIGYIRSPHSFAVSAFQQMLKDGGLKTLTPEKLWPHYRQRFGMLEDVFGADRMSLRLYDRKHLLGADIVRDFGSILGLDIAGPRIEEANVSLSAEATALLFLQRRLGEGYVSGFENAQAGNHRFIERLRVIGERPFKFSDQLWGPVLKANEEDVNWIESKLGTAMIDDLPTNAVEISGEDDFIQLAAQSYEKLEDVLIDEIRNSSRPIVEKTTRALDILRRLKY